MPVTVQITFDCADPNALAGFWCEALGYQLDPPPEGFSSWPEALKQWGVPESEWNSRSACSDTDGAGPRLFFQRVPEGKSAKNRVHLDLRAAPGAGPDDRMDVLRQRADQLADIGATIVRIAEATPMDAGFIVMLDPEGNEFCLD